MSQKTMETRNNPERPEGGEQAEKFRRPGFHIVDIEAGGPADKAGLKDGDVILAYDGSQECDRKSLYAYKDGKNGKPVTFTVRRGMAEKEITITSEYSPKALRHLMGFFFSETSLPVERTEPVEVDGKVYERRTGGYVDKHGNLICRYSYDLETEPVTKAYKTIAMSATGTGSMSTAAEEGPAYRMRSYVLTPQRSGASPIDLIQEFNPKRLPVYVIPGVNGGRHVGMEIQVQPTTGTPIDAHLLLHELRHSTQDRDPRLSPLLEQYRLGSTITENWTILDDTDENEPEMRVLDTQRHVRYDVKKANDAARSAGLGLDRKALMSLEDKLDELGKRLLPLYKKDAEGKAPKERIRKIHEEILAWEIAPGVTVLDVLLLPQRVIERDAEFGALTSLRKIRKEHDIDLLSEFDSDTAHMMNSIIRSESPERLAELNKNPQFGPDERARTERFLQEMGRERFGSKVIDAVRRYMNDIGATPSKIRAHKKAAPKDNLA